MQDSFCHAFFELLTDDKCLPDNTAASSCTSAQFLYSSFGFHTCAGTTQCIGFIISPGISSFAFTTRDSAFGFAFGVYR